MTTLTEYAHQHFPQHPTTSDQGNVTLAGHTAVAHVIGRQRGGLLELELQRLIDDGTIETGPGRPDRVMSLVIEPTEPTVAPEGGEDPEGIFDLPHRRVAAGAAFAAIAIGAAIGVVGGLIIGSVPAGIILGSFAAILGGVIGAMSAGGGRYAGNRAWQQEHAPDRAVVIVAVLLDDEESANRVAAVMSGHEPEDVRILNADGAWHSPNV